MCVDVNDASNSSSSSTSNTDPEGSIYSIAMDVSGRGLGVMRRSYVITRVVLAR